MARPNKHRDVEFHVGPTGIYDPTKIVATFAEAAAEAVMEAVGGSAQEIVIDVCIFSEAGARWYGGDDAVEQYREDPEASVFERITVRADAQGRIA